MTRLLLRNLLVSCAALQSALALADDLPPTVTLIKELREVVGRSTTEAYGNGRRDLILYLGPTADSCVAEMETQRVAGEGRELLGYQINFRELDENDLMSPDEIELIARTDTAIVASDRSTRSSISFVLPGQGYATQGLVNRLIQLCSHKL